MRKICYTQPWSRKIGIVASVACKHVFFPLPLGMDLSSALVLDDVNDGIDDTDDH